MSPTTKKRKIVKKKKRNLPHRLRYVLALSAAILAFLLYANTLSHEFAFDDHSVIADNWVVKKGVEGIPLILTTPYRHGYWQSQGTLYRPLSLLMFAMEWELAPDQPELHHFVNVLLYALTGLLLWLLLLRWLGPKRAFVAFAATLLFITHPIHTEAVANIKSRDELLCMLGCILAAWWYYPAFRNGKLLYWVLALLSYTLALFAKESAVTFWAVLLVAPWFFLPKARPKELFVKASPFLLPIALYLLARQSVLGRLGDIQSGISLLDNPLAKMELPERLMTAISLVGLYLQKLLIPYPLLSERGYQTTSEVGLDAPGFWLSLLLLAALSFWTVRLTAKKHLLGFALLFFGATFSIFSNLIIVIGSPYGERFLYMPSLGFCLALAWGLSRLGGAGAGKVPQSPSHFVREFKRPLLYLIPILLIFSGLTLVRNPDWKNSFTLYQADVPKAPDCAKLRYHYGLELNKRSQLPENKARQQEMLQSSVQELQAALAIYPKYSDAYAQLGLVAFRMGNPDRALENYQQSIEYNPNQATTYSNMGIIYFQKGQLEKAQSVYEKAIELDPAFVDAYRNLGSVHAQAGRFDQAIEQFAKGLKYDPQNAVLHYYLGMAYRDSNQPDKAQIHFDKAYALDPSLRK